MAKRLIGLSAVLAFLATMTGATKVSNADPLQDLYQAAKKEREVIWQVPTTIERFKPVIDAFREKFPEVELKVLTLAGPSVPPRIIVESQAGKVSMDVAMMQFDSVQAVIERDFAVGGIDWSKLTNLLPGQSMLGGRFITLYETPESIVYNTKLVKAEEAPKSYEDLLDPKWRDYKICCEPDGEIIKNMYGLWKQDKQKVVDYLNRLKNVKFLFSTAGTETATKLVQGEVPLAFMMLSMLPGYLKEGAPVALTKMSPIIGFPYGAILPKGSPHPNAGKLLLAWLGGPEGRAGLLKAGRGLAGPCGASPLADAICAAGVQFQRVNEVKDVQEIEAMRDKAVEIVFKPR